MGGRIGELLLILLIVFLIFGSKRLKDFGGDLGAAIKGFKKNVGGDDKNLDKKEESDGVVIDGKAEHISSEKTSANDQSKS
jgi:sec-independent protein translocase protein TatA